MTIVELRSQKLSAKVHQMGFLFFGSVAVWENRASSLSWHWLVCEL